MKTCGDLRKGNHCRVQVLVNVIGHRDAFDAVRLLHVTDKASFSWERGC
jgi:hypothetical protein